jgi:hypothetical protein
VLVNVPVPRIISFPFASNKTTTGTNPLVVAVAVNVISWFAVSVNDHRSYR